jgi:hypothetical protein
VQRFFLAARSALFLFLLLAKSSFAAEPLAVTFSSAGPGCPAAKDLNDRVARLVGTDVREASAHVSVTPNAGRYDVVVSVRGKETGGERRFSADSCALAVDAAALVIAISIFPERALELTQRASESSTPKQPSTPPAAAPILAERAEISTSPPASLPRAPVALHVSVGPVVDGTSLPRVAVGAAGLVGVALGSLTFEAFGAVFDSQTVQSTETQSAQFWMQSWGLRGCYAWNRGAATYGGCAGVAAVRVAGSGRGTDRAYDDAATQWGPALGAVLRIHLVDPVWLRAHGEVFVPGTRRPFLLDGREVHRPAPIDISAFLGPELSF